VWPTGQRTASAQRADRYVPDTLKHPARMLPAVAAYAIEALTAPGQLVLDPMCGAGTTLVEALRLGRHAVGIDVEPYWACVARDNIAHSRRHGIGGYGHVITADARALPDILPPAYREQMLGRVSLVLTSPPYGAGTHGQVHHDPTLGVVKRDYRYSTARRAANLAHHPLHRLLDGLTRILTGCVPLLAPGGYVVLTARPWREHGELIDLPGAVADAAIRADLQPVQRCVALLGGLRDQQIVNRASFFQRTNVGKGRADGLPWHLITHEDVIVLKKAASLGPGHASLSPKGDGCSRPRVLATGPRTRTPVGSAPAAEGRGPNLDDIPSPNSPRHSTMDGEPIIVTDTASAPLHPRAGRRANQGTSSWAASAAGAAARVAAPLAARATTVTAVAVLAAVVASALSAGPASAAAPSVVPVARAAVVTQLPVIGGERGLPRPDGDEQGCGGWRELTPASNTPQGAPTVVRVGGVEVAVGVRIAARCSCPAPAHTRPRGRGAPSSYQSYPDDPGYRGYPDYPDFPGYPSHRSSWPGDHPSYPPSGYPYPDYPGYYPPDPAPADYLSAADHQDAGGSRRDTTCRTNNGGRGRPSGTDWPSRSQNSNRGGWPASVENSGERNADGAAMRINVPGIGVDLDGW
jgi:SAM-dependent methyltransferase